MVFNSEFYFDEETQQGRNIDAYAIPMRLDSEFEEIEEKILPFSLQLDLVIECKKSESHAWVFYTRTKLSERSGSTVRGQVTTTLPELEQLSPDSSKWFLEQECLKLHYNGFYRAAVEYDELKKKQTNEKAGSHRNEIFEAINQLVKSVNYLNRRVASNLSDLPVKHKRELIMVLFPIIVFDGDMFEVFFKGNKPTLWRKNHIFLSTRRYCPYCKDSKPFTIDVVHRSYFEEFLDSIKQDYLKTGKAISLNHKELMNKIEIERKLLAKLKSESVEVNPK